MLGCSGRVARPTTPAFRNAATRGGVRGRPSGSSTSSTRSPSCAGSVTTCSPGVPNPCGALAPRRRGLLGVLPAVCHGPNPRPPQVQERPTVRHGMLGRTDRLDRRPRRRHAANPGRRDHPPRQGSATPAGASRPPRRSPHDAHGDPPAGRDGMVVAGLHRLQGRRRDQDDPHRRGRQPRRHRPGRGRHHRPLRRNPAFHAAIPHRSARRNLRAAPPT